MLLASHERATYSLVIMRIATQGCTFVIVIASIFNLLEPAETNEAFLADTLRAAKSTFLAIIVGFAKILLHLRSLFLHLIIGFWLITIFLFSN